LKYEIILAITVQYELAATTKKLDIYICPRKAARIPPVP
jgi:hypothetical protein